jgi:hypothetical protein
MRTPLKISPSDPLRSGGDFCLAGNRFVLAVWFASGAAAFLLAAPTVRDTGLDYGQTYLQAAHQADPGLAIESRTNRGGWVVFQYFRFSHR